MTTANRETVKFDHCVVCGVEIPPSDDDDLCAVCEMNEHLQAEWERDSHDL